MFGRRKSCQSCGMPLAKDEMGGGTETDGTKSSEYCSHCYRRGQFLQPNMTVDAMIWRVQEKLLSKGMPQFLVNTMTKGIPDLKRWKRPVPVQRESILATAVSLLDRKVE